MHVNEKQLERFVLDSSLVSKSNYKAAQEEAEKKKVTVGEALVKRGELSKDDLRRAQAYVLGIPFVNLKGQKLDFEVLSLIPEPIARNHNIVAFRKTDKGLEVAMIDTDDLSAIEFIKKKTGLKMLPRMTDDESLKYTLLQY